MKAVVLQIRGKNGVIFKECDKPSPKPGEAIIRMEAASLNRVDIYMVPYL